MSDWTITTQRCPDCSAEVDWTASSWCPSCGFYPALNHHQEPLQPKKEEVGSENWWEEIPVWLLALVAGICAFVMIGICAVLMSVRGEPSSQRASSGEPLQGTDDSIPVSIRRDSLPATRGAQGDGTNPDASGTGSGSRFREVECLVLGYTTNGTGEIRSLLLAAAPDLRFLRFVGKIPVEQVDPEVLGSLTARFAELSTTKPMVRCPYGGRWVEPELFCIATYDGWTFDNRLNNAEVVRLVNTEAN